jgi:hypothetical protein
MTIMCRLIARSILLTGALGLTVVAQEPTGIISGTVTDPSGAVVPSARITITHHGTGASRVISPNTEGLFSAPALPAGDYEVRAELQGFRTLVREAEVVVGSTTTVGLSMTLGERRDVVRVEAATAQISHESYSVGGVIQREDIQGLPLNGRSFLQLAALEPGVTVSPATTSQFNALFSVSVLGGIPGRTLVTLDGGIVNDAMEGGTSLNFSQEAVQEFQLSQANFDLATGITGVGAVNVVTRSGSNDLHGSVYFFFRDHNMAAYPALNRNPFNPKPFFARRNPGFAVGGPIKKDKLFFFFNFEKMNQSQAVTFQPDLPSVAGLASIFNSPYRQNLFSARLDYRLSAAHSLFLRYSHDGNKAFGPNAGNALSQWVRNRNWSDQGISGLTSVLSSSLVNDVRFEYQYWINTNDQALPSDCVLPCVGGGLPPVSMIGSSNFVVGGYPNSPQSKTVRRYEYLDTLTWQKGAHRLKFGADITRDVSNGTWGFCLPLCTSVLAPETVRSFIPASALSLFPNLPSTIRSNADILNLPVFLSPAAIFTGIGIGGPQLPGPYHTTIEKPNTRPRFYAQDTWRVRPNLTLNYGVGYEAELGLFNSDLAKPAYLAPIFGARNLSPTEVNLLDFTPAAGFAWSPGKDNRTVIRGGAGIYYDSANFFQKFREEAAIGPVGNGRLTLSGNILTNIFQGIVNFNAAGAPVPVGASLALSSLTNLTLGEFLQIYSQQIGAITQRLTPPVPASGPFSTSGIDVAKQAVELYPKEFLLPRSYHMSIGAQRDLGHDMVVSADYVRRITVHAQLPELDLNRFNQFVNGVRTPVIPVCTPAQQYVPGEECSTGAITGWVPQGRTAYHALLVKLNKRFSNRYQFVASYALQSLDTIAFLFNLNSYFAGYGNVISRHNLTFAGIVKLPWGFDLSVNSSFISRQPVMPYLPNIDLSGTTGISNPLPGLPFDCLNVGCGKAELIAAVDSFNATYTGTKTPNGTTIPKITLPTKYQLADSTVTQDLRVSKAFAFTERYKLSIFGEIFNAFNIANLTGFSYFLNASFGQPTQRATQVFGSGGPRAVQAGARFVF